MTPAHPQRRGLRRSVRLFRSFLVEQTEPERFYSTLADDSIELLREHTELAGRTVLDVGAGPSEFARAFRAEVQPLELASALRRAMDDRATMLGPAGEAHTVRIWRNAVAASSSIGHVRTGSSTTAGSDGNSTAATNSPRLLPK